MTRQAIKNAYEPVRPDPAARQRMLNNILAAAGQPAPRQKTNRIRRAVCIAAVIAACLALTAIAYAAGFFGLWNLRLNDPAKSGTAESSGPQANNPPAQDLISLQGLAGTPSYQACQEWYDFRNSYDPDGAILEAVGNQPTGLSDDYEAYECYTREMADKIDEICEKYGLALLGPATVGDCREILRATGIETVFAGTGAAISAFSGFYYADGSFHFEGQTTLSGADAPWIYPVDYQFIRTMKGSFDTRVLNVGNLNSYEQWQYTAQNGTQLLLALSDDKALILADCGSSFVSVNILNPSAGDIVYGEMHMDRAGLEAIAETFDFSYLSGTHTDAAPYAPANPPAEAPLSSSMESYDAIIRAYGTAAAQQWDAAALMDAGLNYMAAYCYGDAPLENLGYAVTDLDGDGIQELAIGTRSTDEFYGKMILELYTLGSDGKPVLVFSGVERNRYYYAGENRFANIGAFSASEGFETTVKYENGEMIDMTHTTDPAAYMQMELTAFPTA